MKSGLSAAALDWGGGEADFFLLVSEEFMVVAR